MPPIIQYIFLALILKLVGCEVNSQSSFEEYLEYVNKNIGYAMNYVLPETNFNLYNTDDNTLKEYGTYDFIIVGGGTAGTLLARRLSEISQWKILLLEAGDKENAFTDIPFMNAFTRNSDYNWGFKTVPQKNSCLGMTDRKCVYPTGKGLGGSGIIGDMVYARGNGKDFDEWVEMGFTDWSYEKVLPYFKKIEGIKIPQFDEEYHGTEGLLQINHTYPNPLNYEQYLEASKMSGLNSIDINGQHQIGISKFPWTIDFRKRLTGGNTFILPIIDTAKNLDVVLNAFVTRIDFSKDIAEGVEFVKGKQRYMAKARKEILLCAGAIGSPQLLLLSGVGPKEQLNNLEIPVVNDLPVGKYLMDHPAYVGLYVRTNQTAVADDMATNLKKWLKGEAPLTTVFSAENIAFINTKTPGVEPPNIEILSINPPTSVPPGSFYNLNNEYTASFKKYNTLTDYLVYCILIDPKSRGYVKLKSSNPADFPLINPAYYTDSNNEDIDAMFEGIKFIFKTTKQPPLQSIGATIISESPSCEHLRKSELDKDYWYCGIKHLTSTLYHPTGTTRMGFNSNASVVDEKLKVHGLKKLRVVDAGIMPKIVRGHPLAAVFMIAEKAADYIKGEYGYL